MNKNIKRKVVTELMQLHTEQLEILDEMLDVELGDASTAEKEEYLKELQGYYNKATEKIKNFRRIYDE